MFAVNFKNGFFGDEGKRLTDIVCDADTGEILPGQPSGYLTKFSEAYAACVGGTWLYAAPADKAHVYVHKVRLVTYEQTIGALVRIVCELSDEATSRLENRNEDAYDRSIADYYGGDGPQTQAERDVVMAREELAEFHSGRRRGWSAAELARQKRLQGNLDRALAAAGVEVDP